MFLLTALILVVGSRIVGTTPIQMLHRTVPLVSMATVQSACCAAVPGTTLRGAYAPLAAPGTTRRTATTSSVFGLPGRSRETGACLLVLGFFISVWGSRGLAPWLPPGRTPPEGSSQVRWRSQVPVIAPLQPSPPGWDREGPEPTAFSVERDELLLGGLCPGCVHSR